MAEEYGETMEGRALGNTAGSSLGALYAASKFIAKGSRYKRARQNAALMLQGQGRSYSSVHFAEGSDAGANENGEYPGPSQERGRCKGFCKEFMIIYEMVVDKPINAMLIFVPAGIIVTYLGCSETVIFVVNFLAMVPLASLLGDFTEEVAAHTNETMGGLIQATLGNAVEIVVALQALYADQIRVVQASLLGSVFSNMLLVLGCCFFFGGDQKFSKVGAVANMSLLLLSSLALVLPTPLSHASDIESALIVSRFSGVFLLFMYVQLLFFQFSTHAHLFASGDDEPPQLRMVTALLCLTFITALVALLSEYLVDAIDGFTEQANLSKTFVGLILLPIIGNAVEHITAVTVAIKGKMELAMGVAVGSATQVSMFVVPVAVLSGWIMGRDMTLIFPNEEIILYVLSIIIVSTAVSNGESNWLQGSLLVTTYVLVGVACWYEKVGGG